MNRFGFVGCFVDHRVLLGISPDDFSILQPWLCRIIPLVLNFVNDGRCKVEEEYGFN